jgi:hypothetical protein
MLELVDDFEVTVPPGLHISFFLICNFSIYDL